MSTPPPPPNGPIFRWLQVSVIFKPCQNSSDSLKNRDHIKCRGSELQFTQIVADVLFFKTKRQRKAAVSSTKEACEEASARAKEKSDEKWRGVLREHLDKAAEEAVAVAAAVGKEHDAVLEETQQAFRM